jgi:plastocyanin
MLRKFVVASAAALAIVALLPAVGTASADEAVTIKNFAFDPPVVTIHAGSAVVWTNEDPTPHSVVDKGGTFKSPKLTKGATFSQTFAQPGMFDYVCGFHPSMKGQVVVTP